MLDINPLSFLGDIYRAGKLEKWLKLAVSCSIAAFVGFFGTLGLAGAAVLAAGHTPAFALASGFFSACLIMATSVLLSVKKSGLWKDLSIVLPTEFGKAVENTDLGKPQPITEADKRAAMGNLP